MFLGEFAHTLDAKGRLTIPARFRTELVAGLVITRGFQDCLAAYPQGEWLRLATRVAQMPTTSQEAMAYSRLLFGGAAEVVLDTAGRILIPGFLRDYAGIKDQAVLVGVNTHFEIWEPTKWHKIMEQNRENLDAILATMASMGL
jgi:MraZ protein